MDLPQLDPEAVARGPAPGNRQLLATQRGPDFFRRLFDELGLLSGQNRTVTPATQPVWDYVLVEPDAGCGDALRIWLEWVEKTGGRSTQWVGAGHTECRSNTARHRHIGHPRSGQQG